MGAHLALGAAAALAGLAALRARQGSRSRASKHHLLDLPYDMQEIIHEGLYILGIKADKAQRLVQLNPVLPITMQPMHLLWSRLRKSFPGVDLQGVPADLWAEKHWDYRGPPHVTQLCRFLRLLLPTQADRKNPERIRDRLLSGDMEPRWGQDLAARTWEDVGRDAQVVIGLQPRSTPTPAHIGTTEGTLNVPPVLFIEDEFLDGRHRLFAARMAGLSHFPVADLADLVTPRAPRPTGSSNPSARQLHHGGPAPVKTPKPGTFFSSSMESAVDYARCGPNQSSRTPQRGVVSTVALSPDANVERFGSFQRAYDAYQASSSTSLARKAVSQGQADVVQIYDEHIIVNPKKVTFLGLMIVEPS